MSTGGLEDTVVTSELVEPPSAFLDRWVEAFHDVYDARALGDITWFTATAGTELVDLVRDGVIRRGDRVIDLGCGPAVESLFLAVHGMRVVGVDLSRTALGIGRRLQSIYRVRVAWANGDILSVPLADGCADVVNDSFIFHNIRADARPQYANEVYRLLRPGGIFVLRGYSDHMSPGSGPHRLTSREILETFLPRFDCELLRRFRGLPTEKRPEQWHWMALFRRPPQDTAAFGL